MLNFEQRFGRTPQQLIDDLDISGDRLSALQLRVANAWANDPLATPFQIAIRLNSTSTNVANVAFRIKRRLSETPKVRQGHRPVVNKIVGSSDPLQPDIVGEVMQRLTRRHGSVLGAAMAYPQDRTGDLAKRLGVSYSTVSIATRTIRETVAFVQAKNAAKSGVAIA